MKRITTEQIKELNITSKQKLQWVDECLKQKSSFIMPPKMSIKDAEHKFYNIMPTIMESINVAGLKLVNRYPNRKPTLNSEVMLYNYKTGYLDALIEADMITAMRTGAVAVHSIKLLAVKDFSTVAILGLGEMMKETFGIFADEYKGKKLTIKLYRYKDQAEKFIKMFAYANFNFVIVDTYEELMSDSDVIISAITFAEKDFCDIKYYKQGCLLVPIHTLGFQNCDVVFDKIFGDDYGHICGFKYFDKFKRFNEVSEVLNAKCPGRENDNERIIAYNIGLSIHDLYYSKKIIDLIDKKSFNVLS